MTAYSSDLVTVRANKAVHGENKENQSQVGSFVLALAPAINDTIGMLYLPPFARVLGAEADLFGQADSNGTATLAFTLGDGGIAAQSIAADTARYLTATTIGRVTGIVDANAVSTMNGRAQNFFNNSTLPLLVYFTCTAVAATFVAGSTLRARLTYLIDEPSSLLNQ